MSAVESTTSGRKKSWVKRIVIGVGVGVAVLLVGGYVLVPVIAGSKAPGIIESAVGDSIKGSVKVGSVSVGWGGPVVVKGLELRDPEGNRVGVFDVESSLGIWKVLGGLKDLGTTKLSGRLDVVRTTDASGKGTTNLERAIASKVEAAKGSVGSASGPAGVPALAGRLVVSGIDATYEEKNATGGVIGRAAMKGLNGSVEYSTFDTGKVDVKLDAAFGEKLDGPATGSLAVKTGVTSFIAGGTLAAQKASIDAVVDLKGAPVNLIDALAAQGGLLSGALGPTADATVKAKGTGAAMSADVVVYAPNATADLGITTEGSGASSRLKATRKGSLTLRSLAFVEKAPGVAGALKDAGVAVTKWPGVTVAVTSLDVPASGEGSWAGSRAEVSAFTTGEINGTITRTRADGKAGTQPVNEALVVKPVMVGVIAPDIVKGVEVIGNTEATIGGQSAGALDLNVQVSDLIGADGKLVVAGGGMPGRLVGVLDMKAMATGLLAPLAATSGLPLDLPVDVGPTLDVRVSAMTKGSAPAGSVPPTDIAVNVKSANVTVFSTMLYDATGLGLARENEPTKITVERAGPLVQRLLAQGSKPGETAPTATGACKVEIELTSARLPVSGKKIDRTLISAGAKMTVSDLSVRLPGKEPIDVGAERLTLTATALPRTISPIKAEGRLLLNGQPLMLNADMKVAGLLEEQQLPRLPGLDTRRVSGAVALTGISGTALQGIIVGSGASDAMKRVAAELVGSSVGVRIDLGDKTSGGTQPLNLTVTGQGLNAQVQTELKTDALEVLQAEGGTTLTDALARGVLEVAGQKGEALSGARLREATGVSLRVQPLTVPLKVGTFSPEWSRAKSIVSLTASLARPAIVDGLMVDGRPLSAGVAGFSIDGAVPLSIMDKGETHAPGAAGLRLSGSMDLVGNGEADVLARLRVSGGSAPDGSKPSVNVTLTDVATGRLDEIAGRSGLLPGLLGDRAQVTATLAQPQPGETEIGVDIDSPQVTLKKAMFVVTKESYRSSAPFVLTLTATPALIDRYVLGASGAAAPGGAAALRAGEPVKATLSVSKLVISAAGEDVGGGPMKPGVFAIDAVAVAPRLVLIRGESSPKKGGASGATVQDRTTELTDFTATLKSTGTVEKSGIAFTASVGAVKSGGHMVTDPTVVRGSADNLADVGGRIRAEAAVFNLTATTGRLPTSLIESLISGNGQLTELLGDEVTADVEARDLSRTGTAGFMSLKFKSPKASAVAGGPVSGGVLDTGAPGATPLRVELTDFKFDGGGELLSLFPVFATMQRAAGEANKGPATITTRALRVPIDGDMSKLSGAVDIDIGRVDYEFSRALGTLMDDTIFRGGRGQDQRPVPKFTVDIDKGVLRYGTVQQKVLLPVRNLDFNLRGVVDLVNNRIDVVTYIPTLAAAPGLVSNLNSTVGGSLGKLVPGVVDKITAIPVRTLGPLDNPTTAYAPQIVLDEFKDVLKPENLIKGIGDLLGGGKDSPAPAKPVAPAKPATKPPAPSNPTGPTAPPKKK